MADKRKAHFITDMDIEDRNLRNIDTGVVMELPRYAAWGYINRDKNEVMETSNDLQYLQEKYGEGIPVVSLTNKGA